MRRYPRWRWLPLLWMCWMLSACAALPKVDADSLPHSDVPSVNGVNGPLSGERAKALLARRWSKNSLDLRAQAALEEQATGVPLIAGNKCTLLFDGPQTMSAMMKAIGSATNNINLESYIFDQDELGKKLADLLIERQQHGVVVNLMVDSVGTLEVPQAFFERMRAAGIHIVSFNPVNPAKLHGNSWKINNRDHRKLLVVDGKVAFTGGINISEDYARSSLFRSHARVTREDVGWRDTEIKVEGPAVAAFQWLFVRHWVDQDADDLREADYFPRLPVSGDRLVRVLGSDPGGQFEIYKAYTLAMQEARQSIHLTSAYFVPDRQTVDALIAAAQRGVDVKLVLPGVSDRSVVFYAGHDYYDALLAGGVKIYQLKLAVLHAKTGVIDGAWSTVGSTNLDTRSFLHNSELNVIVMGPAFGGEMEQAFQEDLRNSSEITLEAWRHRPWADRLREWSARLMGYWL